MKRISLALATLLLLASCGADPAPAQTPQNTPPADSLDTPTPDPVHWWSNLDIDLLPVQPDCNADIHGVPCRLMGQVEGTDIALYCGMDPVEGGWLLRKGDQIDFFPAPIATLPETPPRLSWADFDGDGAEELAILFYDRPQAVDLHLYEWDNGWTDHFFGPEIYTPLLDELLQWQISDQQVAVSCDGDAFYYNLGPNDTGHISPYRGFDDLHFYRIQDTSVIAVFGLGIQVDGQVRYIGDVTAQVCYDGSAFSLTNLQLAETTGV